MKKLNKEEWLFLLLMCVMMSSIGISQNSKFYIQKILFLFVFYFILKFVSTWKFFFYPLPPQSQKKSSKTYQNYFSRDLLSKVFFKIFLLKLISFLLKLICDFGIKKNVNVQNFFF